MDIKEIRYINLSKNIGKRIFMVLTLIGVKYPKKRIEGVVWNKEKNKYVGLVKNGLEDYVKEKDIKTQNGIIGCWLAHTNAIKDVEYDSGMTVILEDDFVCKKDFFEHAITMVNQFDLDFDVIFFDPSGTGPRSEDFVRLGVYDTKGYSYPYYFGSQCLFINNRSISKILRLKDKSQIRDYDGFLLYNKEINTYIFYTGKSKAVRFGSDTYGKSSVFIFLYGLKKWFEFRKSTSIRDSMPIA